MEGVILSSWDYIMGPQIEKLWFIKNNKKVTLIEVPTTVLKDFNISRNSKQWDSIKESNCQNDLNMYSLMCGQLLLGEMDAPATTNETTSRTFVTDFRILTSIVFRMKSWIYTATVKEVKNVSLCIGLICKRDAFDFIFENQFTIDRHFRILADFLQNRKPPYDSAFGELTHNIVQAISLLNSLYQDNLGNIQNISFSSVQDISVSSLLSKAIVSHLQTSGRTTVLGGSEYKIKQVIHVLSLFSNEKELSCSLAVNNCPLKSNVSTVYIQGRLKNSEKDCEYLLEHAYNESVSLTVVDTDLCKVWQTYPYHINFEKNRVFAAITEIGNFIPQLLKDLSFASKNNINCTNIIQNFTKSMLMKAVSLVKTVIHFREIKKVLSAEELLILFTTYTFEDLQIVLGSAEKIWPGIRRLIS